MNDGVQPAMNEAESTTADATRVARRMDALRASLRLHAPHRLAAARHRRTALARPGSRRVVTAGTGTYGAFRSTSVARFPPVVKRFLRPRLAREAGA